MSSLDSSPDFPDWKAFRKREEVFLDTELLTPAAEMASIMGRYQAARLQAQQVAEEERQQLLDLLARQAVLVTHFGFMLERYELAFSQQQPLGVSTLSKAYRSLRIVKAQMLDALQSKGLEIEVPIGKSYDQVDEVVNIEGWRHHKDYTSELVVEVIEPIVRYKGGLIQRGRVLMGAPLEEDTKLADSSEIENAVHERDI
jgi:hypothetical protein